MLKKIVRHSSWLVLSQAGIKVLTFGYTLFLASSLGVIEFGVYTFALSFFLLLNTFSDFGVSRYLIKEVSTDSARAGKVVPSALVTRFSLLLGLALTVGIGVLFFESDRLKEILTILALVALLPQAITVTFENVLVARQKFTISATLSLVTNLLTILLGSLLVIKGYGVMGAVVALLISQLLYCVGWLVVVGARGKLSWPKLSGVEMTRLVKGSLPYGILGILGLIYFRVDTLLLFYLRGAYETGIYGFGYKFFEGLVFIPAALAVAVFPQLVKLHLDRSSELKALSKKMTLFTGSIGVAVMIAFIFILPIIIRNYFPSYLLSIPVVQILGLAIPAMFIHVPLSQLLTSSDKYLKPMILVSIIPVCTNILLNLWLIPKYGFIGAAWVTVFSDFLSLALLLIVIRRTIYANR